MTERFYVTTPIYYVNDVPHIGHAYTTIAADVLSRYHRAKGREAFFLTGTDEHGQKVARAAKERGIPPQRHCDELVVRFQELWTRLNVRPSYFIRTTDADHKKAVQNCMQKLFKKGLIEKRTYEGWYSTSSERFWTEKDLIDGKDPDTGLPVEWISESAYFFLMSKYQKTLIAHLKANPNFIRPQSRYNEVLGFLEKPLDDLCVSRPKTRLDWGIEIPFDSEYVTYVWFDALVNYISAIGHSKENDPLWRYWPANFHIIGKDILTTHSIYWITMLFALDVEPPRHIYAHGWWTVEGRKMSKSLRNVVNPHRLIDTYGADAVRYFLLREVPFGLDGDFSHSAVIGRINSDLGNDLGNALNRAVSIAAKAFEGKVPEPRGAETDEDKALKDLAQKVMVELGLCLDDGDYIEGSKRAGELSFSKALEEIWTFVRAINKYIDAQAPWSLMKEDNRDRLSMVLYNSLEALRVAAVFVAPFMPAKAEQILIILGVQPTYREGEKLVCEEFMLSTVEKWGGLKPGKQLRAGEIIFPRVEPETVEDILKEILSLCETREEAAAQFSKIFPKAKKNEVDKWLEKLYKGGQTPPETHSAAPAKKKGKGIPEPAEEITYDEFARIDIRVGEVLEASRVENSDKLIKLIVDIGERRQIVAGIGGAYKPEELIGKKIAVIANLKPVTLMGVESRGMLLAAGAGGEDLGLCELPKDRKPGTRIK